MVNPRKAYPVDPGLIPIYERSGRPNWGHALESAVFLDLERRGYEMGYVRTPQGFEVDFLARIPGEPPLLVQVCTDVHDPQTYDRQVRALAAAAQEHRKAGALLITLESTPPSPSLPAPLQWRCAADWLLGEPPAA
jgi:predicted AAA+ superfamily ATPase